MTEASLSADIEARMEAHRLAIELELLHPWPSRGQAWWTPHFWRWTVSRLHRDRLTAECASQRALAQNYEPQTMAGLLPGYR